MWITQNPAVAILPLALLWVSAIGATGIFYLVKLDRLKGVTLFRATVILVAIHVLDGVTFWWSSGGKFVEGELNVLYMLGSLVLPHSQSFLWGFIISTALIVLMVFMLWVILRLGFSKIQADRFTLAFASAVSVLSLVGTASNIFWILLGSASPFLIG